MIGCVRTTLAAFIALAGATTLALPAHGEDPAAGFDAGWDDPNWVINSPERRRPPLVAPEHTGSTETTKGGPPTFQVGRGEVRLEVVDGVPGATIAPHGGAIELGVGISPRTASEVNPIAGFGALPPDEPATPGFHNGVAGALSFTDTRGPMTQSWSLSAPLSEGSESAPPGAPESGFKTMFGLGYNF